MYLAPNGSDRIEMIRTWQMMNGVTSNFFVEPKYTFSIVQSS